MKLGVSVNELQLSNVPEKQPSDGAEIPIKLGGVISLVHPAKAPMNAVFPTVEMFDKSGGETREVQPFRISPIPFSPTLAIILNAAAKLFDYHAFASQSLSFSGHRSKLIALIDSKLRRRVRVE